MEEGIIKFDQELRKVSSVSAIDIKDLTLWRSLFFETGLIGKDGGKYGGSAFGNLSKRIPPFQAPLRKRKFIITGTQTSAIEDVKPEHYIKVLEYYPERNLVVVEGLINASSESLTHGALYDLDNTIKYVFHTHSPEIWNNARGLGIPVADKKAVHGSVELIEELERLFREEELRNIGIFTCAGSRDGVFSFGKTAKEAGLIMMGNLHHAMKL